MPFAFAGSLVQGQATKSAAQTSANATLEAARLSADAARFRPVGVTTRYGSSNFQFDDRGNLINAGYNVSPELRGYQDQLLGLTGRQLQQGLMAPEQYAPLQGAAGGLFDLSSRYLAQTPEESAQKYIMSQQNLLAPSRERQLAELRNRVFQTGREGFSTGGTGLRPGGGLGLSASNPEMEAYYNAIAGQDAELAANAEQEARNRIMFGQNLATGGAGLLGSYQQGQIGALTPFQTSLGLGGTIEQMGQTPLDISAALAGRSATAGANVGKFLLEGGLSAAKTMQSANALSPLASALSSVSGSDFGKQTNKYLQGQIKNWWESPSGVTGVTSGQGPADFWAS
jgi:hypothetical protein